MNENNRAKDFRYIYTNAVATQFTGVELMIKFGLKENPSSLEGNFYEEVGVIMTPAVAKTLAITMSKIIDAFESASGQTIPVNEDGMKRVDDAIAEASRITSEKKPT